MADTPRGVIEPAGTSAFLHRPRWRVYVAHGLMSWGPDGYGWFVTGDRAKAEAKARWALARYLRENDDGRQPSEVLPADLDGGPGWNGPGRDASTDVTVDRRALRLLLERAGVNPATTAFGLRSQVAEFGQAPRG